MGRSREIFRFGPFVLDVAGHTLTRAGAPVALTPKLFDLLRILVASEGRLLEKGELMQAAWPDAVVEEGNLAKGVILLRQALGDTGENRTFIETVPRVGYRFVASVTRVGAPVSAPATADHAGPGETRYAKSGDVHVAYQVVGEGRPGPGVRAGLGVARRARVGGPVVLAVPAPAGVVLSAHPARSAWYRALRSGGRHAVARATDG